MRIQLRFSLVMSPGRSPCSPAVSQRANLRFTSLSDWQTPFLFLADRTDCFTRLFTCPVSEPGDCFTPELLCYSPTQIRQYTRSLCVYIFTYIHTASVCMFIHLRICTRSLHVGVYIFTYRPTDITCVCICIHVYGHQGCMCVYISTYIIQSLHVGVCTFAYQYTDLSCVFVHFDV